MKKLLIAAAVAAITSFANAGAYTWGFATPTAAPGETIDWDTGDGVLTSGTAMLFIGSIGETMNGSNYSLDFSGAQYVATGGFNDNDYNFGTETSFSAGRTSDYVTDNVSQTYTLILFDQDGVSDYENYEGNYYTYTGSSTLSQDADTGTDFAVFITDIAIDGSDWKTAAPETIPEPTSGLLMLVGLAGLALRRKQA